MVTDADPEVWRTLLEAEGKYQPAGNPAPLITTVAASGENEEVPSIVINVSAEALPDAPETPDEPYKTQAGDLVFFCNAEGTADHMGVI